MLSESWQSLSRSRPAVSIQYSEMLAAKITATWHRVLYSPSHFEAMTQCSTLWMSHCREKEWDGADCRLQYSASFSEVSCSTVLWISTSVFTAQLLQQSLHQVLAGRPLSQTFSNQKKIAIPDVHLDHPLSKCSKIHPIFHPNVHPGSPKIHRQSSSSSS